MVQQESNLDLSKTAVIDILASRITRDIEEAFKYVEAHEIVGILEMIKTSIATQSLTYAAKEISDVIVGDSYVN